MEHRTGSFRKFIKHFYHELRGRKTKISSEECTDNFCILPDEILCKILENLDYKSLARISQASKKFYLLSNDANLWQKHYLLRFEVESESDVVDWKQLCKYYFVNHYNITVIEKYITPYWFSIVKLCIKYGLPAFLISQIWTSSVVVTSWSLLDLALPPPNFIKRPRRYSELMERLSIFKKPSYPSKIFRKHYQLLRWSLKSIYLLGSMMLSFTYTIDVLSKNSETTSREMRKLSKITKKIAGLSIILLGTHLWSVLTYLLVFRTKHAALVLYLASFMVTAQNRHPSLALYFFFLSVLKMLNSAVKLVPLLYKSH